MCLAAFAIHAHPRFPVVIAANRDEFFARPAAPLDWWADAPDVLAGRDLHAGGTWFGLHRNGRLGLLTNVREPHLQRPDAPSRGALITQWLASTESAEAFAAGLPAGPQGYNGFNLITADLRHGDWHWVSNRSAQPQRLAAGVHGLSNAALNTPWPKTRGLTAALHRALATAPDVDALIAQLMDDLADATPVPDAELPDTGVGLERERALAPRFVRMPQLPPPALAVYGTRCSTVLVLLDDGQLHLHERTLAADGREQATRRIRLTGWP
ncbi:NRDE family protein [Roseateles sp. BYS87W]|uniref:NRDE family protein n=1 Tax=Pelomonas baiyunensis TaxID=3299026 RepID=A0ABW7H4E6_9BURK